MTDALQLHDVVRWLDTFSALLRQHAAATGIARGLAPLGKVSSGDESIGALFTAVGMSLVSAAGITDGPYYGTFFVRAGMGLEGTRELDAPALAAALRNGLDGVLARDSGEHANTTMADGLAGPVAAVEAAAAAGRGVAEAAAEAASAAREAHQSDAPTTLLFEALLVVTSDN